MRTETLSHSPVAGVIYAAKSSADERGSIPTQIADCRAWADREGWTIAAVYEDEAESAYTSSRGDGLKRAKEHAAALAAEHGSALVMVQHTDRLARGDGKQAAHLVEIVLWGIKNDVRIRSVQDDRSGEDLLMAALMGQRNHEDSKRKSGAVRAGKRRRAERGEFVSSVVPDGYVKVGSGQGSTLAKDPERQHIIVLIFGMALEGRSNEAISMALSAKGIRTRGDRGKPRAFTTQRVGQSLNCAAYAGLVVHQGEVLPGVQANWPRYIDPEDWHRLQRERAERSCSTRRGRGRQPTQHLLRGLARCGVCGGTMIVQTERHARQDGTRRRYYECQAAHQHGKGTFEWCAGPRIDAAVADPTMLAGLDAVLSDELRWRDAMVQWRRADAADLERQLRGAAEDREAAERAETTAQRMAQRYLAEGNERKADSAFDAVAAAEREGADADTRRAAILDALESLSEEQAADDADLMLGRLREAVSAALEIAEGDAERVNNVLREWLEAVVLHREGDEVVCVPRLNARAAKRIMSDRAARSRVMVTCGGETFEMLALVGNLEEGAMVAGDLLGTPEQMAKLAAAAEVGGTLEVAVSAPVLKSQPPRSTTSCAPPRATAHPRWPP